MKAINIAYGTSPHVAATIQGNLSPMVARVGLSQTQKKSRNPEYTLDASNSMPTIMYEDSHLRAIKIGSVIPNGQVKALK